MKRLLPTDLLSCSDKLIPSPPPVTPTPPGKAFSHVVVRLGFHMAPTTKPSNIATIVKDLQQSGEFVIGIKKGVSNRSFKRMSSVGDLSRTLSTMSMGRVVE